MRFQAAGRRVLAVSSLLSILLMAGVAANADESREGDVLGLEARDGLARIDHDAMSRQADRIREVGATFRGGFGGVIFDPVAGELTARFVDNNQADGLLKALGALSARAGDVPVRFAKVHTSLARMTALQHEVDTDRTWAGANAHYVHSIYLDQLAFQLKIDASAKGEELARALEAKTGLAPAVTISPYGLQPQSRRQDASLYQGGQAIWDTEQQDPLGSLASCTTGFRMMRGSNSGLMSTAGHCGNNGHVFWHPQPAGIFAQTSSNYSLNGTDLSLLGLISSTGGFSRYSWFGDKNTTDNFAVSGKYSGIPEIGDQVYISGANSGLTHGVVTGYQSAGSCNFGNPVALVNTMAPHAFAGHTVKGDSGAPVTSWNVATDDPYDLKAQGSHTCGNNIDTSAFIPVSVMEQVTGAVIVIGGN